MKFGVIEMSFMVDDVLTDDSLSNDFRTILEELVEQNPGSAYCRVLVPTESNNDVDGSQHGSRTDFTYEDASYDDIVNASTIGFYEHFSGYEENTYTGNSYDGNGHLFAAVVVDPPAYAVDFEI